jgi:hypothetical protein
MGQVARRRAMAVWPREGAHGSAVNSDEEENVERLPGAARCGFDGLNWGVERW